MKVTNFADPTQRTGADGSTYYTLTIYCDGEPVKDIHYDTYQNMCLDASRATAIIADRISKGLPLD